MHTRANDGIFKQKGLVTQVILPIPISIFEVMKYLEWVEAMTMEFKALVANGTWELVLLPEGNNIIGINKFSL